MHLYMMTRSYILLSPYFVSQIKKNERIEGKVRTNLPQTRIEKYATETLAKLIDKKKLRV